MNDNNLHLLQASLVACIMSFYALNVGCLIVTKIRDRSFNEKVGLPFPCLIRVLCEHARVPIKRHIDRQTTMTKFTSVASIKDMDNLLYKEKSVATSMNWITHCIR